MWINRWTPHKFWIDWWNFDFREGVINQNFIFINDDFASSIKSIISILSSIPKKKKKDNIRELLICRQPRAMTVAYQWSSICNRPKPSSSPSYTIPLRITVARYPTFIDVDCRLLIIIIININIIIIIVVAVVMIIIIIDNNY